MKYKIYFECLGAHDGREGRVDGGGDEQGVPHVLPHHGGQ